MLILSWNCRGLARPAAFRFLRARIKEYDPDLVFLAETKVAAGVTSKLLYKLGFADVMVEAAEGLSGGLGLGWKKGLECTKVVSMKFGLSLLCSSNCGSVNWVLSAVYGPSSFSEKKRFWNFMTMAADVISSPWLIFGDLNSTASVGDRSRTVASSIKQFELSTFMLEKDMIDIGASGCRYTWSNKRKGCANIRCKLDRAIANGQWCHLYPDAAVKNLPIIASDHGVILISTGGFQKRLPKPFRFFNFWTESEEALEVVKKGWKSHARGPPMVIVSRKIAATAGALRKWSRLKFGALEEKLRRLNRDLGLMQSKPDVSFDAEKEEQISSEIKEILRIEELKWHQYSRVKWVEGGERNTRYYHLATTLRRRQNSLDCIKNAEGSWLNTRSEIGEFLLDQFTRVYASTNPYLNQCLYNLIPRVITVEDNLALCRLPDPEEIRGVVFAMNPGKAPGPDGMNARFYQAYWNVIGQDVSRAVRSFFEGGLLPTKINETFIALLPKTKHVTMFKHLRPISLSNVLYKIIASILTSRLKLVLEKLISPMQSGFIKGRTIHDNVVLAHEILHWMKRKGRKKHYMMVKIDWAKAYDTLEWSFILRILEAYGFDARWVNWVKNCITSVSYHVLMEGSPIGKVVPERGLRQGDPLSPLLFILAAETLSKLLAKAEDRGAIKGIKVASTAPAINHLMYADDTLICCQATVKNAKAINKVLDDFCTLSGLNVNREKTRILFCKNSPPAVQRQVKNKLRCHVMEVNSNYLGLPLVGRRLYARELGILYERVAAKIAGWKKGCLSMAGRGVMIKSVLQSLPTHMCQVFSLPIGLCDKVDGMFRDFWWGFGQSSGGQKHCYLKAWNDVCKPKGVGGYGFRRVKDINSAFLTKQCWRLLTQPYSLLSRVLLAKYNRGRKFLDGGMKKGVSWFWQGIQQALPRLRAGACRRVGDGEDIDPFEDPWVPLEAGFKPKLVEGVLRNVTCVKEFFQPGTKTWDEVKLRAFFVEESVQNILNIKMPARQCSDSWVWLHHSKGIFSVKTAYLADQAGRFLPNLGVVDRDWGSLWKAKIRDRHKLLVWRVLHLCLPTRVVLGNRFEISEKNCPLCSLAEESVDHLCLWCPVTRAAWFASPWGVRIADMGHNSASDFFLSLLRQQSHQQFVSLLRFAVVALDWIWKARNAVVHEKVAVNINKLVRGILQAFHEYEVFVVKPNRADNIHLIAEWSGDVFLFDAAVRQGEAFVACVWLDEKGKVMAIKTERFHSSIPLIAEAEGALCAIRWAKSLDLQCVKFCGDSSSVISCLADEQVVPDLNILHLVWDARDLLRDFMEYRCAEISRNDNVLAHNSAAWSASCRREGILQGLELHNVLQLVSKEGAIFHQGVT